ncbi:hypothetical protein M5D96_011126 [Drosophila gunungcola]|uniref:Uncharacterized protein n=1 Tax=Drosophila gunungcola TaxID=103775 RepID=A0A9Q0BKP1_9MUSC|nr:hypothetical protein M5D96_011126 [Drosophila gunungcola]
MKKFMLMRGLFQQPPSDNVIVITQPSGTTTTTTPTGSPTTTTTTTTTTTPTSNSTGRSFQASVGQKELELPVTTMTGRGLEDRLDLPLPNVEEQVPIESPLTQPHSQKKQWPKKLRLKKRNLVKKTHRRVHKHPQKRSDSRRGSPTQSSRQISNETPSLPSGSSNPITTTDRKLKRVSPPPILDCSASGDASKSPTKTNIPTPSKHIFFSIFLSAKTYLFMYKK